jgi:hypothetical protein
MDANTISIDNLSASQIRKLTKFIYKITNMKTGEEFRPNDLPCGDCDKIPECNALLHDLNYKWSCLRRTKCDGCIHDKINGFCGIYSVYCMNTNSRPYKQIKPYALMPTIEPEHIDIYDDHLDEFDKPIHFFSVEEKVKREDDD